MKVPYVEVLHLDQRRLPSQVWQRVFQQAARGNGVLARQDMAWNSFGKPGRDPGLVGDVAISLAHNHGWDPHLQMARLRNGWKGIVGESIALHTTVVSLEGGVLTIRAESTVWSTQLTFMVPQLKEALARQAPDLTVDQIVVTGPRPDASRHRGMRHRSY